MAKKRKMVEVVDREQFEKNKQALLQFESQMVQYGALKDALTDVKALRIMVNTCGSLWGVGKDLYLCSQQRALETLTALVVAQVDDCISQAVKALADWLELKITYTRRGSNFSFRCEKPGGEFRELQIPIRHRETENQRSVN